jgi:hypothetical protein
LKGIDYWGGIGVVEKIIFKSMLKNGLRVWSVFNCFK